MLRLLTGSLAMVLLTGLLFAGQFNKTLNIGDKAPEWKDLPGIDGKKHSLADLKDKDIVVVVFTCNSCPVAEEYEDRIISFSKKYAGRESKVALVAICVNLVEEDRLPKLTERAKEKGFNFPYLSDESQIIGKAFGANYTPEFFVLDRHRKIAYMGAMDDHSPPAEAKSNYLEKAVDAVLKGEKPETTETLARGCRVRYSKSR
jgi:peroxiredoxin